MSKSLKKGYSSPLSKLKLNQKKSIKKVWSKDIIILSNFIDLKFKVYTGNRFIIVNITEDMVGHRLGEFINTRKKHIFKKGK
jgi:small subunit ribosomal protein S19